MEFQPEVIAKKNLVNYIIRLGDDRLILGHRLSEWCGHAAILEEDIALGNIALDLIGQASAFYNLAASIEGNGRSEDDLAFFRNETEFQNLLIVEQQNIDFAYTIVRQYLYDVFESIQLDKLKNSSNEMLAGIASKAIKENKYHVRHSQHWMLRLGDGTEGSNTRVQNAINDLWHFTNELFKIDDIEKELVNQNIITNISVFKEDWLAEIESTLNKANIKIPKIDQHFPKGGRQGFHTEHLGHLLSEMQIVARSHPGVKW
jgi:ring-1,2-phenylacetyl-CoA epoxidase subunit PaaC